MAKAVNLSDGKGNIFNVEEADLQKAVDLGYTIATPEEVHSFRVKNEAADSPIKAAVIGATRGLTAGISDPLLAESGFVPQEELQALKEQNPTISTVSEVAGMLAPQGVVGKVGKGALALESAILKKAGETAGGRTLAKQLLAKATGMGLEGSVMGVGQVLSESALGDEEVTGEKLLAGAGLGAGLGVAASGLLGIGGKALSKAGEAVSPLVKKGIETIENIPVSMAKESEDAMARFMGAGSKWFQDTPDSVKQDIVALGRELLTNKTDDLGNVLEKKGAASSIIGANIDDFEKELVKVVKKEGNSLKEQYSKIDEFVNTNQIDDTFKTSKDEVLNLLNTSKEEVARLGTKQQAAKFNQIIKQTMTDIGEKEYLGLDEVWKLRKSVDDKLYNMGALAKQLDNPYAMGLQKARTDMNDLIFAKIDNLQQNNPQFQTAFGDGSVVQQLKDTNKRYFTAQKATELVDKQVAKESAKRPLSAVDTILGAGAFIDPASIAILGAKKIGQKYQDPALAILGGSKFEVLSKMNQKIQSMNKKIDTELSNFFSTKRVKEPMVIKSLLEFNYDKDSKREKDEDNYKAMERITNQISSLQQNPDLLTDKLAGVSSEMSEAAPKVAQAIQMNTTRALSFLGEKMPKNPFAGTLIKSKWKPSDSEMAKFRRYLTAVEDPLKILKDLNNGIVSTEGVEVLKNVYPKIYEEIVIKTTEKISDYSKDNTLSYQDRLQLSLLMDIPVDNISSPEFIMDMQQQYQSSFEEKQQSMGGGSPVQRPISSKAAGALLTDTQRISSK